MKTTPEMLYRLERTAPHHVTSDEYYALIYDCRQGHLCNSWKNKTLKKAIAWIKSNATEAKVLAKVGEWE